MPHPWMYADEKLYRVIYTLATGREDVRKRLLSAWDQIYVLHPGVVPESLHEDLEFVRREMTKFKSTSERREDVEETMGRIHKPTGEKIAERLWNMWETLQEEIDQYRLG